MKKDYKLEDFPRKARYIRHKNRIYFSTSFKDNEELTLYGFCSRPNAYKEGLALYSNGRKLKLINIADIKPIKY